ncbi:MAG: SGNH/GDSL hydrolase family protein [Candidatus Zixiibacteriota bacterium]
MSEVKKTTSLWIRIIGVFIPLFLFIAVTELALHLADPNFYYKNQFFPINRDIDFPEIYKKDSDLFWRFRENITTQSKQFSYLTYHINSSGFRGPEIDKEKNGYRILALGNSCTFGWGVENDNTWVRQLDKILNSRLSNGRYEVINAGVPGYSSHQGKVAFAKKLTALKPDMVLVMFGWNDHWAAGKGISDKEQQMPGGAIIALQNVFSKMKLYQLMRKIILSASEKPEFVSLGENTGKQRVSLQDYYLNLATIAHLARENGAQPVFMIPPVADPRNYFNGVTSQLHQIHRAYQEQMRRLAMQDNIPLIDLQHEFERYDNLYTDAAGDPTHFNERGHRVTAEAVVREVLPVLVSR